MISCMGGWCRIRDTCVHYHSEHSIIQDRLCEDREHYRHLLAGVEAPMSGEGSDQDAPAGQGQGAGGTERGRQEVAGLQGEVSESV